MIFEKWKAILGTGVAGAGVGGILGAVVLGVSSLIAPGSVPLVVALGGPIAMGAFGFVAAGGFAAMLAVRAGGTSVDALSVWRSGAMGMAAGALFPALGALLTGGWLFPFEAAALMWSGGAFGVLGAGLTAGLVAVAKHQSVEELGAGHMSAALPAPDDGGEVHTLPPTSL